LNAFLISPYLAAMRYKHIFFDLDHTLWDFEMNAKETLAELFLNNNIAERTTVDFEFFFKQYSLHNEMLWAKYTKGEIKQEELRWKRMWLTLLDCDIYDEPLARSLAVEFLQHLPSKKNIFPYTVEILTYLQNKGYQLHLITNGFDDVQHSKILACNIHTYFGEVVTSECSNSLKPNKEIFEYALAKAKASKEESIMIGDNIEADIKGAANAGLDTVFVNHINASTDFKPTYTIYHLQELENIL
jgi:putative hydrolase of the HAD superfamily